MRGVSSLYLLLSIINMEVFSIFEITPTFVFNIDSNCYTLFDYVFPFCLAVVCLNADIPSRGEASGRTQFYVRRPEVLVPRQPLVCNTNSATTLGIRLEQNIASCSVNSRSMDNISYQRGSIPIQTRSSFHQTSEWTGLRSRHRTSVCLTPLD